MDDDICVQIGGNRRAEGEKLHRPVRKFAALETDIEDVFVQLEAAVASPELPADI